MPAIGQFSISEFAKFTRTTRDTLLHYDRIGLLSPVSRGENNYRYYFGGQLAVVNVIRTLQQLGMTLDSIKDMMDHRTPELTDKVLECQIEKIDKRIEDWNRARKLLLTLRRSIHSVLNIDEDAITIQYLTPEAIVLGEINDFSGGRNDYDALLSFYQATSKKYPAMDMNYPVWAIFSKDRVKQRDWVWPDRYYFFNPDGPDKRPAALYAIGYTRGGYGQSGKLYDALIKYIDNNGFEICGDAYEEYPLNELCVISGNDYLIRIMITVREKPVVT